MRFYFLRHPETRANERSLIYGWGNYDYTEKGEEMFREILPRMDDYDFDRIYTSPLDRARKLAEAIGARRDKPVIVEERLKEMHYGILEGMPYPEAVEKYPEVLDRLFGDLEHFTVPEGESIDNVTARVGEFLDEIKEDEGAVLLITHSMLTHTALSWLLDLPRNDMWHFKIDPCMLIRVDYHDGYGVLKFMIPYEETDGTYIVNIEGR